MSTVMNRRRWFLRTGGAAVAGLTLGPRALQAGTAGIADIGRREGGPVRLHLNENPLGPSPRAREAVVAALGEGSRYPNEAADALTRLIAEREGVAPAHVVLGAGSSEVLCMAGLVYGAEGGEIVAADPSYLGLTRYAETAGATVRTVPLDAAMAHDLPAMERAVANATRLVYICNPNNPTGTIVPAAALRRFCEAVSGRAVVFVDEAYLELIADPDEQRSMVDLVRDGRDVIVARTFSKLHGMAGLRIGYGIARPEVAERLRRVGMAGPSLPALRAAVASLADTEFLASSRRQVDEARQATYALLDRLGYRYVPSHGNFVFFDVGRPHAPFAAAMRQRGVLVARAFPPFTTWCRVSMGTPADMAAFAEALAAVAHAGG